MPTTMNQGSNGLGSGAGVDRGAGVDESGDALQHSDVERDHSSEFDRADDSIARLIGSKIGKYDVIRVVGKGGMGCVYEAVNTSIQKRVALKLIDQQLAENAEAYERFNREAMAASAIESPHIVQIFDAGKTEEGVPFIVMELLKGSDLGRYLAEVGRLAINDAIHVTLQVLKGLHHAHTAGIVHRDLKPDNVFLVDRDDDPVFVKLLDFGVSKISRNNAVPLQTLTRQGTVVGTPFYMSPEQAQAFPDVDGRTDIYSVGALLFECLAGRPPHSGKSYEQVIVSICMKDADDVRTHNPSVPAGVAAVIKKALEREREDRFESARAMLDALVDGAPDSFRQATSSSKLRGVSLGGLNGGIAHTPMVISPSPVSRLPSGLADTVNLDTDEPDGPPLTESGVSPKSQRMQTLPSDDVRPAVTQAVEARATPRADGRPGVESISAPMVAAAPARRRWALAAAPGVALLLSLGLYLNMQTGETPPASAVAPTKLDAPAQPVSPDENAAQRAAVAEKGSEDAAPPAADDAAMSPSALAEATAAPVVPGLPTQPAPNAAAKIRPTNDVQHARPPVPSTPLAAPVPASAAAPTPAPQPSPQLKLQPE